jgi:membrane protein DedA with SNARE-associated domain
VLVAGLTSLVGDHGLYAVFLLLIAAALVPAASELVMLYAGAVASGAIAGAHVVLFGNELSSHGAAYVAIALAGLAGNLVGAGIGWAIGVAGGRPLLERHGRKIHVSQQRLDRAERWFERNSSLTVVLGFAAPFVRSFVAIPAGIAGVPLVRFLLLAAVGCGVFCFGLAGVGWAAGSSYGTVRGYLDVAVAAALVLVLVALLILRRRRGTKRAGRADHPAR